MRSTFCSGGRTQMMSAVVASAGQKLDATKGNVPPSGKAIVRNATGTSAPTVSRSAGSRRPMMNQASPAIARNAPATGLARAVRTASSAASQWWRRWSASSAASATAMPSAKVRRPVMRLTEVAAANQRAPARAPGKRPLTSCSKKKAAATADSAPATRAPSSAPSGGNRML